MRRSVRVLLLVFLAASLAIYCLLRAGRGTTETQVLLRSAQAERDSFAGESRNASRVHRAQGNGGEPMLGAPDIHFSIKTASHYHDTRLAAVLLTWMQAVPEPSQVRNTPRARRYLAAAHSHRAWDENGLVHYHAGAYELRFDMVVFSAPGAHHNYTCHRR